MDASDLSALWFVLFPIVLSPLIITSAAISIFYALAHYDKLDSEDKIAIFFIFNRISSDNYRGLLEKPVI